ncbi:hypothetical protein [Caballeronia sp. Lep1P3]|jgi:hypothetical protein|uniref:hypothetical protein n=1 Tax=Caballeronia sp. Lep1P3 TaxID=2878150 RepID=UPI001FD24AAF|nr:hypothetical protein [Caballeronia sp. Lep1P3]
MDTNKPLQLTPDSALYLEARALSLSVAAIRKARGKKNPQDFPIDCPEWHQSCAEFAYDVLAVLETPRNWRVTRDV